MTEITNIEEMTFEESLEELEKMVQELETGGLGLDKSLEIYERAIALRNHCREILEKSERRVQKIMETSDGIVSKDISE